MAKHPTRRTFLKQLALTGAGAACSTLLPAGACGSSPNRRLALADTSVAGGPIDVGDRRQFMLDELFV